MPRSKLSNEQIKLRIECVDKGLDYKEAANKCGCSENDFAVWSSTHGLDEQYKEFYRSIDIPKNTGSKLKNDDLKHYKYNTNKPPENCVSECKTIVNKRKANNLLKGLNLKQTDSKKHTVFSLNGKIIGNQSGQAIT